MLDNLLRRCAIGSGKALHLRLNLSDGEKTRKLSQESASGTDRDYGHQQ